MLYVKSIYKPELEKLLARQLAATEKVREAYQMFDPATGFGDPDAEMQAKMWLESARFELEQVNSEIQRTTTEDLATLSAKIQRHQIATAWLAIVVAAIAAIPGIIALLKK